MSTHYVQNLHVLTGLTLAFGWPSDPNQGQLVEARKYIKAKRVLIINRTSMIAHVAKSLRDTYDNFTEMLVLAL